MNELLRHFSVGEMLPRTDGGDDQRPAANDAGHRSSFWQLRINPWHAVALIAAWAVMISLLSALLLGPRPPKPAPAIAPPIEAKDQTQAPQNKSDREPVRVIPIYPKAPSAEPAQPIEPPPKPLVPKEAAPPEPIAAAPPPDSPGEDNRASNRRKLLRHWREPAAGGDICARHGMHRVTRGKGWRCVHGR